MKTKTVNINWQNEQDKDYKYLTPEELQGAEKFFKFMRQNGLATQQAGIIALWTTFKTVMGWQKEEVT